MSTPPTRAQIEDIFPLSPMQQGLLFHSLLEPGHGVYMPHVVLELTGELDAGVLRRAWQETLDAHDVLRAGFFWEERDEPFQVVYRRASFRLSEHDWRDSDSGEYAARLDTFLTASRMQPFDLHEPPLLRVALLRRAERCLTLVVAYHHLILDGWSAALVLEEVLGRVRAHTEGRPPPLRGAHRYRDYIAWLARRDEAADEAFWREHVSPVEFATRLPFRAHADRERSRQPAYRSAALSEAETARLREFAQAQQVTVSTLVHGAFALLLGAYNDAETVSFGSTVAGRPTELRGAGATIGSFINTLPVQIELPATASVGGWLRALQQRQAARQKHEHVALRDLQRWLNDGQPLFECLLVFENYPVPLSGVAGGGPLQLEDVAFHEQTHFPLTWQVSVGSRLRITARYDASRLADANVGRALEHFWQLLLALVADADAPLHGVSPLSRQDREVLASVNHTATPLPPFATLGDWLDHQAAATPDNTAVVFGESSLSYRELHARANRLARHLQTEGAGAEHIVAVHLPRSPRMLVAILAVIKSGAAYLPLDADQPAARLDAMIADARPSLLLFDSGSDLPRVAADRVQPRIDLADVEFSTGPASAPPHDSTGDDALYVIYTSGSTGSPKGVVNTHRALLNRLAWMQDTYCLDADDRVLQKTPVGFDVSVWELFWPLLTGATLVIAEPDRHRDAAHLATLIARAGVTTVHFVPSMLAAFLDAADADTGATLERVIVSGEALPAALQERFFSLLPGTELHNLYGPTEAAIDVTAWPCRAGDAVVPIGRPIANTRIFLLDRHMNQVPVGVPAELYIGGAGLARGYHHDPAKTAAAFVPNPFSNGGEDTADSSFLYRTGDIARRRADGAIEYLGRVDRQLKLRGVRIEPGEIESALHDHPAVSEAAVVVHEGSDGAPALSAYVVGSGEPAMLDDMSPLDWQDFLGRRLPPSMVPAHVITLDALPLSINGKLERRRLPKPEPVSTTEFVPPRNPTEELVAAIWSDVLKRREVGAHDDFFDLGGHSLNANRVNVRLREQLDLPVALSAHFEHTTVAALATHIDALQLAAGGGPAVAGSPGPRVEVEL